MLWFCMYMYIYRTLHTCMYNACTRALTKKHVLSPCLSHTLACTHTHIPMYHNMLLMYRIYTHTHTQNIHTRKCTHIHTRMRVHTYAHSHAHRMNIQAGRQTGRQAGKAQTHAHTHTKHAHTYRHQHTHTRTHARTQVRTLTRTHNIHAGRPTDRQANR
mmetsp:Transcript_62293/g.91327  ORF Transcript_62293/g.91327 Transcript_62293/m.91327 type:complete len:159 (-) Transcript_62293:119-595(-)